MAVETKAIEIGSELGNKVLESLVEKTFANGYAVGYLEGTAFGIKRGIWKGFIATAIGASIGIVASECLSAWLANRKAKESEEVYYNSTVDRIRDCVDNVNKSILEDGGFDNTWFKGL